MKIRKFLIIVSTLVFFNPLNAIQVDSGGLKNKRLFGIEFLENDLSFYGKAAAIQSISLQEYQSGPYIVTEMVIDMAGSPSQLRIYHTELLNINDAQSRLPDETPSILNRQAPSAVQDLINRGRGVAKNAAGARVVKDYPTATHAHTLEFRLGLKEDLTELYDAFRQRYAGKTEEKDSDVENEALGGTLFKL